MSDDIGPGDVVEVVRCALPADLPIGSRWVVSEVEAPDDPGCSFDSSCMAPCMELVGAKAPGGEDWCWCACGFRKIGGSQSDTVTRFAHHLIANKPKVNA